MNVRVNSTGTPDSEALASIGELFLRVLARIDSERARREAEHKVVPLQGRRAW